MNRWSPFTDEELQALHWALDSQDDDVGAIADEIDEEIRLIRGYTWENGPGWVKR